VTDRPYAAALSEHPVASIATGEVVGQVHEALGGTAPDLVVLFATAAHTGALEDVVATVRSVLAPGTLLGATAVSVLAGEREVEEAPALALWAGRTGPVRPVRLGGAGEPDLDRLAALAPAPGDALVLVGDPFTFPADAVLAHLAAAHPGVAVVGGLASAARGPGGNRLLLDATASTDGAVGVLLRAEQVGPAVVSQGCRPVGEPMVVTRAERSIVHELAGRPALERLRDLAAGLDEEDRRLLAGGIHLGVVVDEHRERFGRGDFLVRNVLGGDRSVGAIAVGAEIPVGAIVQFHVRDAESADEDLRILLSGVSARGALAFTCNGRGTHLFGEAHHDASTIAELLDRPAVAGMFCAGELGPVGSRSFLHGFTASVLTLP
jgi:small ligand-binding sensory domain FIST